MLICFVNIIIRLNFDFFGFFCFGYVWGWGVFCGFFFVIYVSRIVGVGFFIGLYFVFVEVLDFLLGIWMD